MIEPLRYPDSNVFINKLDIRDHQKLQAAEADITAIKSQYYLTHPAVQTFDLSHVRSIHRFLFEDLYEWAGEIRGYDLKKGNSIFTPSAKIEFYARQVFNELHNEKLLTEYSKIQFIERLSYYYDLINRLHPFPEGNGRTQRLFIQQLANHNGYHIDWSQVHAWEIEQTAINAFTEGRESIIRMLERIVC